MSVLTIQGEFTVNENQRVEKCNILMKTCDYSPPLLVFVADDKMKVGFRFDRAKTKHDTP